MRDADSETTVQRGAGRVLLAGAIGCAVGIVGFASLPTPEPQTDPAPAAAPETAGGTQPATLTVGTREHPTLRLHGHIVADGRSRRTVTAWTHGRITSVMLEPGEPVRAGEVLAMLSSAELFDAHRRLLEARRGTSSAARQALEAARGRLRVLGISPRELAALEQSPRASREIAVRSPFSGTVLERIAVAGEYVETGAALFRIADTSHFWAELEVDAGQLEALAVGQRVEVEVARLHGPRFTGLIEQVQPHDNAGDGPPGGGRVRVALENPQTHPVRPGVPVRAYVEGGSATEGSQPPLAIPESATLFHAGRYAVYVPTTEGEPTTYRARWVRLGPASDGHYPVVSGLNEGDRILRDAAAVLAPGTLHVAGAAPTDPAGPSAHGDPFMQLPPQRLAPLAPVVEAYLSLLPAFAAGELAAAHAAATRLAEAVQAVRLEASDVARAQWTVLQHPLTSHAKALSQVATLEDARAELEALSHVTQRLLASLGNPLDVTLRAGVCPMAAGSRGVSWIQRDGDPVSPYLGAGSTCQLLEPIAPGAHLLSDPAAVFGS